MLYIKYGIEYFSREACLTCPNRRTDSKREKHVNIGRNPPSNKANPRGWHAHPGDLP